MWITLTTLPFQWNVARVGNVIVGRAAAGEGGIFWFMAAMNCSELMRMRTLLWAMMTAPALPSGSLPPV